MGLDLALLVVAKEFEYISWKVELKQSSKYADVIFYLTNAFENDFIDFEYSDRIEFKNNAQDLVKCYPESKYHPKFYLNTKRVYEVFDYLLAKRNNLEQNSRDSNFFFLLRN